jgi:hypothetical protein
MEEFAKLFGELLAFTFHCFDRIVILGYLPFLTRPESIVHFFRGVHGTGAISHDLREKSSESPPKNLRFFPDRAAKKRPLSGQLEIETPCL